MWVDRFLEKTLLQQARTRPVVVLSGARQTGKTSLVKRLFSDYRYISLDLPSEAEQAEANPELFLSRHASPVIIDEVQYAPALLRHLKKHVDSNRKKTGQYILTGSQPFNLMSGVSESLAGRAAVLGLEGLSFAELLNAGMNTPLALFLMRGGYPELYENPEIETSQFYHSYVATYLERDLRTQLQVGSLRDFERFLRACALRTSQVLNKAELARDVGISPSTAGEWLSVLERSGIVALLEPWFSNATKTLVKSPKLHFMDTGLCAYLMGLGSVKALLQAPLAGALWETAVFVEIRKFLANQNEWQLYYWRDRTKEADFLFHRAGQFCVADAKWSEHPKDAGKLNRVLGELPSNTPAALVCRTSAVYPISPKIQAISMPHLADFLR